MNSEFFNPMKTFDFNGYIMRISTMVNQYWVYESPDDPDPYDISGKHRGITVRKFGFLGDKMNFKTK